MIHYVLLILFTLILFWDARCVLYRFRYGGDLLWPLIFVQAWIVCILLESIHVFHLL